jgi:D-alanyl-lipoteichoic acid acyltransferase DltB (MBOAT superfamily)
MPLGISFFTFQQISYLVDSYRGETGGYDFAEYALFVVFFPQLIAGPIVLHQEMIPQFRDARRKVFNQDKMAKGVWWLAIGLAKKVLIADTLGKGVDWGYASPQFLGSFDTILLSVMYSLQIYFDFSGYCDMASGVASMFGFELPQNFNSPYKATSISDFWDRWHMSLSRFLQKYIYIPLGGNRKGMVRTLLNILIVFLISGIWHGAAWTFVVWGILHGMASVIHRLIAPAWKKIPKVLTRLMTFLFVNFTWIFFRAESFEQIKVLFANLFKPFSISPVLGLQEQFHYLEFTYLADHITFLGNLFEKYPGIPMWIVLVIALFIALVSHNCWEKKFSPTILNAIGSIILLVWSIMSFSGISIFLYFNF